MKKKFISVLLIIALICFTFSTAVSALSFTATMTPSNTTVAEATEFTVTVKVSNLEVGNNGINSLSGYLKYDKDVFETINKSNITALNGWNCSYEESSGKVSLTKGVFVTSTQEVFQIALKTKSGVSGKSGTISYSNINASNSEDTILATDISTSITVGTEQSQDNGATDQSQDNGTTNEVKNTSNIIISNPNNTTNSINAINTVNTVNTTNTTNKQNSINGIVSNGTNTLTNTSTNEDMPQTGVDDTILKLIFIAIAVAIVFYIKIEKINKDLK